MCSICANSPQNPEKGLERGAFDVLEEFWTFLAHRVHTPIQLPEESLVIIYKTVELTFLRALLS